LSFDEKEIIRNIVNKNLNENNKPKIKIMRKTGLLLLIILLMKQFTFAQVTITGTIISADDNLGLPGAAVVVKGTTTGTTTDIDGKYKINVPQGATLVFSFVGMKSQEVVIASQTAIDITLKSDIFKMDEVVVAGVASATPKRNLSVSVAKVDSKELEDVPGTSASSALQGKVAGVVIVSGNGNPGESSGIRLRGSNSLLEGQSPLIIVDGVMFQGELSDINANDIESYEVVKGAAASALYGSQAGSGVLVITTRRGKLNQDVATDVVIRNEYGNSSLVKEIQLATHHPYLLADDYLQQPNYTKYAGVIYPAGYKGGHDPNILGNRILDYDHYADNNYRFINDVQKEIFIQGNYYTNYVSVNSSSNKIAFFVSGENNRNTGIVFNTSGSSRQNFKINIDLKISDKIKITSSTLYTQNYIDMPSQTQGNEDISSGGQGSPFFSALFMSPDINLNLNPPDSLILNKYYNQPDQWSNSENPKHALYYEKRTQQRNDILQNFSLNWTPASIINFDVSYSLEKQNANVSLLQPRGFQIEATQTDGYEYKETSDYLSQTIQFTSNLQKKFGDLVTKGKISYLFEELEQNYFYGSGSRMLANGITSMGNLSSSLLLSSAEAKTISKDYFGIIDMVYKDKYIASILYRIDGSSLFGADSRWNPYYRASLAYKLNEDLHLKGIEELKLHAAIGTAGQRPGFYYQYETYPIIPNTAIINAGTSANSKLKPANTTETEFGINGQYRDFLNFDLISSQAVTSGIFAKKNLPAVTGFQNVWWNAATTQSNTWEATLGAQLIKKNGIDWSVNLTFDRVRQKVTHLDVPSLPIGPPINGVQLFTLQSNSVIGQIQGHDWVRNLKQMANQLPKDGSKTIDDYTINSDGYVILKGTEGTISEKPILLENKDGLVEDVKIGDFNANFDMNLFSKITWKNFGLTTLWVWKQGGNIYNMTKQWIYLDLQSGEIDQSGKPNYKKKAIDYYTTFYDQVHLNSHFVESGTYLKLREISLFYIISPNIIKSLGVPLIKSGRISLLGRNLLTFTKYTGWDPEVGTPDARGSGATTWIIDMFNYPNFRMYSASLELTF